MVDGFLCDELPELLQFLLLGTSTCTITDDEHEAHGEDYALDDKFVFKVSKNYKNIDNVLYFLGFDKSDLFQFEKMFIDKGKFPLMRFTIISQNYWYTLKKH